MIVKRSSGVCGLHLTLAMGLFLVAVSSGGVLVPCAQAEGFADFFRSPSKDQTKNPEQKSEKEESKSPAEKSPAEKSTAAKADTKQDAGPGAAATKARQTEPDQAADKKAPGKTYDHDYVGEMQSYTAKYEDTMVQLARTFNVGFVELRSANPFLDPWIPGEGKKVLVPTLHLLPHAPREGIVMNLAEMRMYAYMAPGKAPVTFPIGIGREGLNTPSGVTKVVRKTDGPTWRPTARMRKEHPELPAVVGPGPDNPMGTHALYLGWPEYAIHGTDKPYSIGRRSSSGCIRMYPENIGRVFSMVKVGTQVTVVNQSVKVGWIGDRLYLEAHPTMEQADRMEIDGGLPGYIFPEEDMGMIVASAGDHADDLDWRLIRQVIRERRGYPVEIFQLRDAPDHAQSVIGDSFDKTSHRSSDDAADAAGDSVRGVEQTSTDSEKAESEKTVSGAGDHHKESIEKIADTKKDDASKTRRVVTPN